MGNVLSQNEIDELLAALASGEADEPAPEEEGEELNVREYNFRTANKFHKEQIRTLNIVYDNFARLLASYLSTTLRAIVEIEVISIEEQTFNEFNNSLPDPVILSIFSMTPLEGLLMMEITPGVAFAMINRLFGGGDGFGETSKEFSEIELSILEKLIRQFLGLMVEAWDKVAEVNPRLDRIETSGQFAQIVSLNETIAIVTMNVTIGETSDLINLCIPHVAIEPVAQQLGLKLFYSTSDREVIPQPEKIKRSLVDMPVRLHAYFDNTRATVGDVYSLQVGDVIQLDHNVNKPININVEHLPKFTGVIGTSGNHYAVSIVDVLEEESANE